MNKARTIRELIYDLSLKLWEYHWKVKCEVKGCEICMLLEDAKEMNANEGEKGVFCLDHRRVMVDGRCPKCVGS
jgi:hypothetical protein